MTSRASRDSGEGRPTRRPYVVLLAILALSGTLLAFGTARASAASTAPARANPCQPHGPLHPTCDYPPAPMRQVYPYWHGTAPQRWCGTYANWRMDLARRVPLGTTIGMIQSTGVGAYAYQEDDAARRLGYAVDHTPRVGALGVMERTNPYLRGTEGVHTGHIFYVARVSSTHPTMVIEEYNALVPLGYDTRVVPVRFASEFVHLVGPPHPHGH